MVHVHLTTNEVITTTGLKRPKEVLTGDLHRHTKEAGMASWNDQLLQQRDMHERGNRGNPTKITMALPSAGCHLHPGDLFIDLQLNQIVRKTSDIRAHRIAGTVPSQAR